MFANQREIEVEDRLEALERAVFGESRAREVKKPPAPVDRMAQIRADAQRIKNGKVQEEEVQQAEEQTEEVLTERRD